MQIIDAMWKPSAYDWVYPLSYLFTFSIATPHSILVQLSFPGLNLKQGAASKSIIHHSKALWSFQLKYRVPRVCVHLDPARTADSVDKRCMMALVDA